LILALQAAAGQPDLVSALLIDTSRARATSDAARAQSLDPDETDALFEREVVVSRPARATLAGSVDLPSFAETLVAACLPALEQRGLLRGGGAVRVTAPNNSTLELDGEIIGLVGESTMLTDVDTGTRTLSVVDAAGRRASTIVNVRSNAVSTVDLFPEVLAPTQWAGAVMAVGGVALTIAGIALREGVARPAIDCASPNGASSNSAFLCTPVLFDRIAPSEGPLTIPLGYSTIAAGLVLLLGPEVMDGADLDPRWWWAIAAGVLATGYGISEAVN